MPDFTNWNLQAVIDTLWIDWLVVWQLPEPGSPVTAETKIVLQIERPWRP
jgi:hypothetical protein